MILAVKILVGNETEFDDCDLAILDVNVDASSDITDVVIIIQSLVGL